MEKTKKRIALFKEAIDKMLEMAGSNKTYDDVKDREDAWYLEQEWDKETEEEFVRWLTEQIVQRKIMSSKKIATLMANNFILSYGPKLK